MRTKASDEEEKIREPAMMHCLNQFISDEDSFACLMSIHKPLIKLILTNFSYLKESVEPIWIASLKALEYLLDTIGCSIGEDSINILKCIIESYPSKLFNGSESQEGITPVIQEESKTDFYDINF